MARGSKSPVALDTQGRVLVPSDIRREKGWAGGERVAVGTVNGLVTVTPLAERVSGEAGAEQAEAGRQPGGVRESATAYLERPRQETEMARGPKASGTVDTQGRVLIPAEVRRAKGWGPGERVVVRLVDGVVMVMTPREAVRKAQEIFMAGMPTGVSLVDELIAERREAARRGD